jgi:hypothetical protein
VKNIINGDFATSIPSVDGSGVPLSDGTKTRLFPLISFIFLAKKGRQGSIHIVSTSSLIHSTHLSVAVHHYYVTLYCIILCSRSAYFATLIDSHRRHSHKEFLLSIHFISPQIIMQNKTEWTFQIPSCLPPFFPHQYSRIKYNLTFSPAFRQLLLLPQVSLFYIMHIILVLWLVWKLRTADIFLHYSIFLCLNLIAFLYLRYWIKH